MGLCKAPGGPQTTPKFVWLSQNMFGAVQGIPPKSCVGGLASAWRMGFIRLPCKALSI